jgi:hypothetical protein
VRQAHPELARYAETHDRLKETMPRSGWSMATEIFLILSGIMTALFGIPAFIGGIHRGGIGDGLLFLLVIEMVIVPLVLVFTLALGAASARSKPTVTVKAGRLHVSYGEFSACEHALCDCQWFVGPIRYVNPCISGRAIILAFPSEHDKRDEFAAVGYSPKTRALWEAFLWLAAVPRRTSWEITIGPARLVLNICVGIVSLPACLGATKLLQLLVSHMLQMLTGDRDLSQLVGALFVIPGSGYAFGYLIVFWPWSPWRPQSGRSPEKQQTVRRSAAIWYLVVLVVVAASYMFMRGFALHARIVAAVFVILGGWFVGRDLGPRFIERFRS